MLTGVSLLWISPRIGGPFRGNRGPRCGYDMHEEPEYAVGSAGNVLLLLKLLFERGELRVSQVADELEIGRSTAHRLLAMLKYHDFAVQDGHRIYHPGPGLSLMAAEMRQSADLRVVAHPHLRALRDTVRETTHLIVLVGNGSRFIDAVEGPQALRIGNRTGLLLPAHITSGGKALLAEIPVEQLRELYPRGVPNANPNGISTLPDLLRQLAAVRRRGYAKNMEESERGVVAVGACVRDNTGRAVAAIAIALPRLRMGRDTCEQLATELLRTAKNISAEL